MEFQGMGQMDIQDMRIFARVAALNNLSAVGQEMGLTPGTISKRIQALEDELNVRLFDRTTRSIRITDEGRTFLSHVDSILNEIELAHSAVSDVVGRPKGRITVSAPASLGRRHIAPAVCNFLRQFPEVDIQIDLTDRIVNLQEGGYDLAIRIGELSDSTLIAKRLAADRQIIVAAPDYIARHGSPASPNDLTKRDCLMLGECRQWSFRKDGDVTSVRIKGRLQSNNGELLYHAALDGQGIFRTSQLQVADEIQRGTLVQLLGDYGVSSSSAIWAVYPSSKHVLPKLRVFLDFLADWFRAKHVGTGSGATAPLDIVAAKQSAAGKVKPLADMKRRL